MPLNSLVIYLYECITYAEVLMACTELHGLAHCVYLLSANDDKGSRYDGHTGTV